MKSSSHRISSFDEDEVLADWLRSHKAIDAGWRSSINALHFDIQDVPCTASSSASSTSRWTKPFGVHNGATSNGTDNDSLAQGGPTHISPALDIADLPEIPFIAPDDPDEDSASLWSGAMHRRPSSTSSERHLALLASHARRRSTSESSTASRPAPARSILSSRSSFKTTKTACHGRSTPSVKFLVPIDSEAEDEENEWPHRTTMRIVDPKHPTPSSSPVAGKKRVFGLMNWLSKPSKKRQKIVAEQPVMISRPMALCDAPRRSSDSSYRSGSSARSVRSVRSTRSNGSQRSVRSCASRLQLCFGRLGG